MTMVIQVSSGESFMGVPVHFEVVRSPFLHRVAPTRFVFSTHRHPNRSAVWATSGCLPATVGANGQVRAVGQSGAASVFLHGLSVSAAARFVSHNNFKGV